MRFRSSLIGVVGGLVAASLVASLFVMDSAEARTKRRRRGGPMRLIDVNVDDFAGVPVNRVLTMTFSQPVLAGSVNPAVFQVRAENANSTGFTRQVPGDFQLDGRTVRFFPRLPTHIRDLSGNFYSFGSERDDADANGGFQPGETIQIQVLGHPNIAAVRSSRGRKLNRTQRRQFTIANIAQKALTVDVSEYADPPPPQAQFSNPPDKVASAIDQYARHGGTREVPSDIEITLFGNKVPLSPNTLREAGNNTLTILARRDDPSIRKPVPGVPFIEQNSNTTRLVYKPDFPLADLGTYALRVTRDVKDLSEQFDFASNGERLRLREIYDFLDTARRLSPSVPPGMLTDPPIDATFDWPQGPAGAPARAILKTNILALGDQYPDEIDPRVMVLFSTRDEPVSNGAITIEFVESDGYFDAPLSTASWDEEVAGAAAGILTIAGGTGELGDFAPQGDTEISTDNFVDNIVNWKNVEIPPGVTVDITGARPATIKAFKIQIEGTIRANGFDGEKGKNNGSYFSSPPSFSQRAKGGKGGPGGGKGGDSNTSKYSFTQIVPGLTGDPGHDADGVQALVDEGGQGGKGGENSKTTAYAMGGGGGGGGAKLPGTAGARGTTTNGWGGLGGAGGIGSSNDELDPFVGGAGGGSGGHGGYQFYTWIALGGGGGGGGGAILIQSAAVIGIGPDGTIEARGGRGGNGSGGNSTLSAGPGGGGGGGSILLRSTRGFDIADESSAFNVNGGPGGTDTGNYVAPNGGNGGAGYIRLEDPNGGMTVAGGTAGVYSPVGGGVPSFVYSKFITIGVDAPKFLNFGENDFTLNAAGGDAILIEVQFSKEDPNTFGVPDLSVIGPDQETTDEDRVSRWLPVRIVDNTGILGGAFGQVEGHDPGLHGTDYVIPVADKINDKDFKFFRVRITFQLDQAQSVNDSFPFVDRMALNFLFNN